MYEKFFINVRKYNNIELTTNYIYENRDVIFTFLEVQNGKDIEMFVDFEEELMLEELHEIPLFFAITIEVNDLLYCLIVELLVTTVIQVEEKIRFLCSSVNVIQNTKIHKHELDKEEYFDHVKSLAISTNYEKYIVICENEFAFYFNKNE